MNNPAIKRIMKEVKEMVRDVNPHYTAKPLEDNLFEWHFTIRGPPDSPFEKGVYHGRIILPSDYPFKPPNILILTPNGRFETNKKICLSISAYHPEFWQPGWSIRTVLIALIGFMPSKGEGAIGALDYSEEERRSLAEKSVYFRCNQCASSNATALPEETAEDRQKIQQQIVETKSQMPSGSNEGETTNDVATQSDGKMEAEPKTETDKPNTVQHPQVAVVEPNPPERLASEQEMAQRQQEYHKNISKRRLDIAINLVMAMILALLVTVGLSFPFGWI